MTSFRFFCRINHYSRSIVFSFILIFLLLIDLSSAQVHDFVRIATYNIKYFSTDVVDQGDRLDKLKSVIEALDTDVLGLEEINDRAALHLLFPSSQHDILIDDTSQDDQDVALVVRHPCRVEGDKSTPLFVFPGSAYNRAFPKHRDLLNARIICPEAQPFTVFVHHAKSRVGGRAKTDLQRVDASQKILSYLKNPDEFSDQQWVVMGDFNDNPDDASANILETGDPNASGREENDPDTFAVNLTEQLLIEDHVSHGLNSQSIHDGKTDTWIPGSRKKNNDGRGTDENTGPILFDQIMVSKELSRFYVPDSIQVFNEPEAVMGNRQNRASDHIPVYADFIFPEDSTSDVNIIITRLLPDPVGSDTENEIVTLKNKGSVAISFQGWTLKDADDHTMSLGGISIEPGKELKIIRQGSPLSLNNNGDTIRLFGSDGIIRNERTYTKDQVKEGKEIKFE